jgi:hypothetical protein
MKLEKYHGKAITINIRGQKFKSIISFANDCILGPVLRIPIRTAGSPVLIFNKKAAKDLISQQNGFSVDLGDI